MSDNIQELCGTLIGDRYQIVKVLGEGGMGVVYLADDNDLGRQVAIKVLHQSLQDTPALARRLEMECTLLAQLGSHPNIVTLLDRQNYDNKTILVMEYVPGEDLSDIIERTFQRTPYQKITGGGGEGEEKVLMLSPRNAIIVAMQCLTALDYAHGRGVLHRDIKPSNIMVRQDSGGNLAAKLMDFGIAKTLKQSSVDTAFTRLTKTEDRAPGTPAYMAPEQIEPDRFGAIGPATDVYAFGVMFFEMLTGQLPFVGGFTELMHSHTNVRPPNPREINPLIKTELAHVVIRSMQKSPANRFKTASEMLIALQEAVGLSAANAIKPGDDARFDFQNPEDKKSSHLSLKTLLFLPLIFSIVVGVAYWQNWEIPWITFGAPVTSESAMALTPKQAQTVCLTFKGVADKQVVHDFARAEWALAEQKLQAAADEKDPDEAVRLFTEAGRLFTAIPEIAAEREYEAKLKEEDVARAIERDNQSHREKEPDYVAPVINDTKTVDLGNGVNMEMVWVIPGKFRMGSREISRGSRSKKQGTIISPDESPSHTVTITRGFWIGQYEVTQQQWLQVMGYNPSRFTESLRNPVEQIRWTDSENFLEKMNQLSESGIFRLPTEAEWEYSCRAGGTTRYNCGNDLSALPKYAWYAGNSGTGTHCVGEKRPNAWGIYDMHGNVAEWVQDWYDPELYKRGTVTNPYGPDTGLFRVRRGGAWSYHHSRLRSAVRDHALPDEKADIYGLRIVLIP
ncbi:MAG: SUMF1/EgtB/PvdO family nonheme iron enzyme [Candidatus Hydrogenedentes bacterium]|nr:SUMF1/EgtB/PvdO family nonheme iron enzyme [Candidatus Hydrogenedentota bacterium]